MLPGDFKIKTGRLRGVESEGMMCSAKELKLAEDAQGLLILPPETKVGAPISEVFPPETVLEIEVGSAVLLQELAHYHKRKLLEQIRKRLPGVTVTDLRFRAGVVNETKE